VREILNFQFELKGSRYPPILSYSPEVNRHQESSQKRKHDAVQHIKTKQCLMTHFIGPKHEETDLVSDEGGITHDRGSNCNPPVGQLIPGEKVSCVTQSKREDEE